ncbi:peroxide stress protein YaaA [Candidatus Pseudothioglobus singularis]|nr:peroxide stress protein YaaA [Candidatus Pseudothioglobus singularis]MDB4822625.1 peroxide stress protein YaaA [Candidatus Pseudothioglobus singularis]
MLAIISPSKTQDFSDCNIENFSQTRQQESSNELINILKNQSQSQISKLMSISEKLSALNFERFQKFRIPFTLENAKQAILAFKGDVYNGIDAPSLSTEDLNFAQDKVRMLSGLYGVIRPLDLIQPYRLEMGTKLSNDKGKDLYEYWGSDISNVLNDDESELIINLASNEYFKAIDKKSLNAKILDIVFKEKKGDSYKVIGIYAKRARGLMVNFIIRNRLDNPAALQDFSDEGYRFDKDLSDDSTWVYLRG